MVFSCPIVTIVCLGKVCFWLKKSNWVILCGKGSNDKLMFSVLTLRQSRQRNRGKCKLIHSFVAKADNCLKFFFGCNLLDAKMETGHCCCLLGIGPSGQGTYLPPMWSSFTPQPKGKLFLWRVLYGSTNLFKAFFTHPPLLPMRTYCLFVFFQTGGDSGTFFSAFPTTFSSAIF